MMTHAVEGKTPPAAVTKALNVVLRPLLSSPLGGRMGSLMVLGFTGRKSGKHYRVPVAAHTDTTGLYALTPAGWRLNFRDGADADVTLSGHTTPMRGELVEDVPTVARIYHSRITELGVRSAKHQIGLQFAGGRLPSLDEVTEMVQREHCAVVRLNGKT